MVASPEGKDLGACLGLTVAAKAAKVHLVGVLKRPFQVDNRYFLGFEVFMLRNASSNGGRESRKCRI